MPLELSARGRGFLAVLPGYVTWPVQVALADGTVQTVTADLGGTSVISG